MLPFLPALINIAFSLFPLLYHPSLRHLTFHWPPVLVMTPALIRHTTPAPLAKMARMESVADVVCYSDIT